MIIFYIDNLVSSTATATYHNLENYVNRVKFYEMCSITTVNGTHTSSLKQPEKHRLLEFGMPGRRVKICTFFLILNQQAKHENCGEKNPENDECRSIYRVPSTRVKIQIHTLLQAFFLGHFGLLLARPGSNVAEKRATYCTIHDRKRREE